jgi:hypothetical protein
MRLAVRPDGISQGQLGLWGAEAVVFFNMNGDLILVLWPKKFLAKEAKITETLPSSVEFSIGHNRDN